MPQPLRDRTDKLETALSEGDPVIVMHGANGRTSRAGWTVPSKVPPKSPLGLPLNYERSTYAPRLSAGPTNREGNRTYRAVTGGVVQVKVILRCGTSFGRRLT